MKPYDLFKLLVALVLAVIAVILLIRLPEPQPEMVSDTQALTEVQELPTSTPVTVVEAPTEVVEPAVTEEPMVTEEVLDLPELPKTGVDLTYNPDDGLLYTPDGRPVFRLNPDNREWEPSLPDTLVVNIPAGSSVEMAEMDEWQIRAENGNLLYRWNPETLAWDTVEVVEEVAGPELPPFPQANFEWDYQPEIGQIFNPAGEAVYSFDAGNGQWVPVLPESYSAEVPLDANPVLDEMGQWVAKNIDGSPLYAWDVENLAWVALTPPEPPPPAVVDCPLALSPRLKVGDTALVMTNLNLRTSPGIENNLAGGLFYNSQINIIGGPVCLSHQEGAYMWWEVDSGNGKTGWSAEGSIGSPFYFLEPVE